MIDAIDDVSLIPDTIHKTLDPFGFFEAQASGIAGLGGPRAAPFATYAFHTAYVAAPPGPLRFTLRFAGLRATTGRIVVQINMIGAERHARARAINVVRLPLAALAADGTAEIACESFPGAIYALVGTLAGDTDAAAEGLSITLAQTGETPFAAVLARARATVLAVAPGDPLAPLFDAAPATLAHPVSQGCTAAQYDEPAWADWLERLKRPKLRHRKQWEFVYILQVLATNGMFRPGRRGLGFGVGREPLPAFMASCGVDVVATDLPADHGDTALWSPSGQHGSAIASVSHPELCDDATLARHVAFRAVDMTRIPDDLAGFDFTWSSCAYEHLGSIAAGLAFVARSVDCLRPGGIAVHTTELNLLSNDDTIDDAATVLFRRRDMERLALELIAAGHEVAPIKLDIGDSPLDDHIDVPPYAVDPHLKMAIGRYASTSFGIAVRRGGG